MNTEYRNIYIEFLREFINDPKYSDTYYNEVFILIARLMVIRR